MSKAVAIKKVILSERHLRAERICHGITDSQAKRSIPPSVSLVIVQYPDAAGYSLLHLCKNGQVADTWHGSIDDALHQAEYEFDLKPDEWTDTNEPFL
jgi:hypothetical protein